MSIDERKATLPGVADIPGRGLHLPNAMGHLVHLDSISAADLLEHEMVYTITGYGIELSGYMARFLAHSRNDLTTYDLVLLQDYNIDAGARSRRGNRTYTSFDGLRRIEVKMQDRKSFGPSLETARTGLDDMIRRHGAGASTILTTLVNMAFGLGDKDDKVDVAAITALRRLTFDDPAWPGIRKALEDAIRMDGTKEYLRLFQRRSQDAKWEPIRLNLAKIDPGPDDFDQPSPRRQAEIARKEVTEAVRDLMNGHGISAGLRLAGLLLRIDGADIADEVRAWANDLMPAEDIDRLEAELAEGRHP